MSDVDRVVYVVLRKGANARVRPLAELASERASVVFVMSGDPAQSPGPTVVVKPRANPLGLVRRLGFSGTARLLDSVVYVHNRHQLYVSQVVARLSTLIRHDFESGRQVTVLTCAPPHALCLVGRSLKRLFPGIRWAIDWQDLWSSDETYFRRIFPLYRPQVRRLERELVSDCDVNVTTNDRARQWLEEQFCVSGDRTMAIPHHAGFEAGSLPRWQGCAEHRTMSPRIVFMGRLFKGSKVPGASLLEALADVRATSSLRPELHLYGRQGPEFERFAGREAEFGMQWHGVIEQSQVVEELRKYDYLLLVLGDLPNSRLIMHLKLSEYLVAGPPILAVVPSDSAVADIVRRTGTGFVVPAEGDWASGLQQALHSGAEGLPVRNDVEIEQFSWGHASQQWMRALGMQQ